MDNQTSISISARPIARPNDGKLDAEWRKLPAFAAVDLGTNTCRMLVVTPRRRDFAVMDSFSRVVRLGQSLEATGVLSEEAMERTERALRVCASKLRTWNIHAVKGVATEACRRASNGGAFLSRIERSTRLSLTPISPEEEARLTLEGCTALLDPSVPRALMFDIGGGSTEVTWIDTTSPVSPRVIATMSAPVGVVSLMERYGSETLSTESMEALTAEIAGRIEPFNEAHGIAAALGEGRASMLGTSGTVTTLGALYLGLDRYDRSKVDGLEAPFEALFRGARALEEMSLAERAAVPCIGRERAELVLVGCAILEALRRMWPASTVRIADRGIREGLLTRMISEWEAAQAEGRGDGAE